MSDAFDSEAGSDWSFEEIDTETNIDLEKENEKRTIENIIKVISEKLNFILEQNKQLSNYNDIIENQSEMVFNSKRIPQISIYDYLERIQSYISMEKNTLIISLIFINKICKTAKLTLTYYNIHRILFVAVLLAIKYIEDSIYDNKYNSEVAAIKNEELNLIEYNFLVLINFNLFISNEVYENYCEYLENPQKERLPGK